MNILAAIKREERKLEKQIRWTAEAIGRRASRRKSIGKFG